MAIEAIAKGNFKDVNAALTELAKHVEDTDKKFKAAGKTFQDTGKGLDNLGKRSPIVPMNQLSAATTNYGQALRGVAGPVATFASSMGTAGSTIGTALLSMGAAGPVTIALGSAVGALTIAVRNENREFEEQNTRITEANVKREKLVEQVEKTTEALLAELEARRLLASAGPDLAKQITDRERLFGSLEKERQLMEDLQAQVLELSEAQAKSQFGPSGDVAKVTTGVSRLFGSESDFDEQRRKRQEAIVKAEQEIVAARQRITDLHNAEQETKHAEELARRQQREEENARQIASIQQSFEGMATAEADKRRRESLVERIEQFESIGELQQVELFGRKEIDMLLDRGKKLEGDIKDVEREREQILTRVRDVEAEIAVANQRQVEIGREQERQRIEEERQIKEIWRIEEQRIATAERQLGLDKQRLRAIQDQASALGMPVSPPSRGGDGAETATPEARPRFRGQQFGFAGIQESTNQRFMGTRGQVPMGGGGGGGAGGTLSGGQPSADISRRDVQEAIGKNFADAAAESLRPFIEAAEAVAADPTRTGTERRTARGQVSDLERQQTQFERRERQRGVGEFRRGELGRGSIEAGRTAAGIERVDELVEQSARRGDVDDTTLDQSRKLAEALKAAVGDIADLQSKQAAIDSVIAAITGIQGRAKAQRAGMGP